MRRIPERTLLLLATTGTQQAGALAETSFVVSSASSTNIASPNKNSNAHPMLPLRVPHRVCWTAPLFMSDCACLDDASRESLCSSSSHRDVGVVTETPPLSLSSSATAPSDVVSGSNSESEKKYIASTATTVDGAKQPRASTETAAPRPPAASHADGADPPYAPDDSAQENDPVAEAAAAADVVDTTRNDGTSTAGIAAVLAGKTRNAWQRAEIGLERVRHFRRELKAVFSSELERCLLKATRPENTAVDEVCMQALLAQANRLAALEASYDCDPHQVVCSKLFKKMVERDWRTTAKALYVVHRLQRDSPPKAAARFSLFIKEKWAEGAGELGKRIRTNGGKHAPWLKVYCGYLATRGRRLETAMNAFRSWETLTSTRQLRNALMETNALMARAVALHFAVDASSSGSNGGSLRRACCELAFQDVADVRAMVCSTRSPPALLGVPGVGEEQQPEARSSSNSSAWELPTETTESAAEISVGPSVLLEGTLVPVGAAAASSSASSTIVPEQSRAAAEDDTQATWEPAAGGIMAAAAAEAEAMNAVEESVQPVTETVFETELSSAISVQQGVDVVDVVDQSEPEQAAHSPIASAVAGDEMVEGAARWNGTDTADCRDKMIAEGDAGAEALGEEENGDVQGVAAGAEKSQVEEDGLSEEVLETAKESAAYEDLSGAITAVYAARYGNDPVDANAPAIPSWIRQMASIARAASSR